MINRLKNISKKKIIITAAAVILAVISTIVVLLNYTIVGGKLINVSASNIDLSGRNIEDFSGLERCKNLETLDIRGSEITADEYSDLIKALPNCNILWSFLIGDTAYENYASCINISDCDNLTASQLDALKFLPDLKSVDASGCILPSDVLKKFNQLRKDLPSCEFSWDINLGENLYPSDITELAIPANISDNDLEQIVGFYNLKTLDVTNGGTIDMINTAVQSMPDNNIEWFCDIYGKRISSADVETDLSGLNIKDFELFSDQLSKFPSLKKVIMCDCGLSDQQMEQLIERYPEKKFVWLISFGRWKNIRTDITCFSTLNYSVQAYDETELIPLFKYCTDLVALDIGHSSIKDISMISNLTNLEALILGDNNILDISPIGTLKKLEYLELWGNEFDDISVLSTLPVLKDLNMTFCHNVKDFEPLFHLPSIEKIWVQHSGFPNERIEELENTYPNAMFSFFHISSPHSNGWCHQERFVKIKTAFRNWPEVVCYNSWDDIQYVEGAKLIPVIEWD